MNIYVKRAFRTFSSLLILFIFYNGSAQDIKFGVTGGLLHASGKIKDTAGTFDITGNDTGFYVGAFAKFQLSEKFSLTPELDYGNLNGTGSLHLFAGLNYYVVPKFYVLAGPQVSYLSGLKEDDVAKAGIDAAFGVGYDITDHFYLNARYSLELSDRLNEDPDAISRLNWLFVGIGYSF